MKNVLIDKETRAVVQGITGKVGRAQTHWMVKAGKLLVAGVTPGKGGQEVEGLPVYDTVGEAVEHRGVNTSVIFVPPLGVLGAVNEALDAGIRLIVIVTEYVPVRDTIIIRHRAGLIGARGNRSQLPRPLCTRAWETGNHAGVTISSRKYRCNRPQRHTFL